MARLSGTPSYLLLLFNLAAILFVSWFASWTYLYSLSGLWQHLSSADFQNILCMSMLISTLVVVDGAVIATRILEKQRMLRKSLEPTALHDKRASSRV